MYTLCFLCFACCILHVYVIRYKNESSNNKLCYFATESKSLFYHCLFIFAKVLDFSVKSRSEMKHHGRYLKHAVLIYMFNAF